MKIKFLLPGLLALVVASAPVLTVNSAAAKQTPPANAPAATQKKPSMAERLNLSDDQKTKIKKIRQETQKQVEAVLNKQQKDQYVQARKTMKPGAALKSLNLDKDQQSKLRGILTDAKKQIEALLTKEQKDTLKQSRGQGRPEEL
jgi:periplasmic protein CpxP/Spy